MDSFMHTFKAQVGDTFIVLRKGISSGSPQFNYLTSIDTESQKIDFITAEPQGQYERKERRGYSISSYRPKKSTLPYSRGKRSFSSKKQLDESNLRCIIKFLSGHQEEFWSEHKS